jgi:hypothetical protein
VKEFLWPLECVRLMSERLVEGKQQYLSAFNRYFNSFSIVKISPALQHNAVSQLKPDGQPLEGQTYYYDKVFDEASSTQDVYNCVGTGIVDGVINGINGTIFACKHRKHNTEK